MSTNINEVLETIKKYETDSYSMIKEMTSRKVRASIKRSIVPEQSLQAIAITLEQLSKVDDIIYDLAIFKMELRTFLEELPVGVKFNELRAANRKALNIVGECQVIAKTRYHAIETVLQGIRSINSSFRSTNRNQTSVSKIK